MNEIPVTTRSATLVTQYFPPERGAAQVRLGSIVREMARRGYQVEVVTALPNYPTGRIFVGWSHRPVQMECNEGVNIYRVWVWAAMGSGVRRILNYVSFGLMSIIGLASARKADWVIVEYPTLFGAMPAVLMARLRQQRVVMIVADLWVDSIAEVGVMSEGRAINILRRLESWMLRRSHVVTAVTEGVREALVNKGVDPSRLAWLPNGADTDLFAPGLPDENLRRRLGLADHEHMVLYAGTHGYVHGLDVVLDAAELLADQPIRFVLVGDGSEKPALLNDAERRGLTNVSFHDPVSPEEVAEMLRVAVAGLATVRAGEIYRTIRSAKMLPTMASGRPVIYSGDDEGAALVAETGAGLVTTPGDGAELAEAIQRLVASPLEAERMGKAGRYWVEHNASWHELVGKWLDDMETIMASDHRGGRGE